MQTPLMPSQPFPGGWHCVVVFLPDFMHSAYDLPPRSPPAYEMTSSNHFSASGYPALFRWLTNSLFLDVGYFSYIAAIGE